MSYSTTTYKSQSAIVPFRIHKGKLEILLITSRRTRSWIIPKGDLESNMSPAESAAKEAWEEAGVKGRVITKKLGVYRYEKYDRHYEVTVYAMEVRKIFKSWLEEQERIRQWLTLKEAIKLVTPSEVALLLGKLGKKLEKNEKNRKNKLV